MQEKNKFNDILEYTSVALQIQRDKLNHPTGHKIIDAPIFFNIGYNDVEFKDGMIMINCKACPIGKFDVVLTFYTIRDGSHPYVWKDRLSIPFQITDNDSSTREFKIEKEIPNLSIDDGFKIEAYRKNGLLIHQRTERFVKDFWPTKTTFTNPIFPLFQDKVSNSDFEKMLFEARDRQNKETSDNFEKAITWLISLLGIPIIWLGKDFEMSGTGTNKTTFDMLGQYNQFLLLINATIGVPADSTFVRESRYKENTLKKMKSSDPKLISVLFSNATVSSLKEKAMQNNVILIGKEEIKLILDHIYKGDIEQARKILQLDNSYSL